MSHPAHRWRTLMALALLAASSSARSEDAGTPFFTLGDQGHTFLYQARPGDAPSRVASMFGIPTRDLPAFLAANGISDARRVAPGFTYRIPNPVATEAAANAQRATELERKLAEAEARAGDLSRDLRQSEARAAGAEDRAARAARLERLWPLAVTTIALLAVALAGAAVVVVRAAQRLAATERSAKSLANEVEQKRATSLAERQEAGRRVLELETRVRELEVKASPRMIRRG